jgi:hypothetical protein
VLAPSFSGTIYTQDRSTHDKEQLSYHQDLHMELAYTAPKNPTKKTERKQSTRNQGQQNKWSGN